MYRCKTYGRKSQQSSCMLLLQRTSSENIQDTHSRFFLRMQVTDRPGVLANITSVFGTSQVSIAQIIQKSRQNGLAELVIITDEVKELYFSDALNILKRLSIVDSISSLIRVY